MCIHWPNIGAIRRPAVAPDGNHLRRESFHTHRKSSVRSKEHLSSLPLIDQASFGKLNIDFGFQ